MSDNNYSNEDVRVNQANYEGENYPGSQYTGDNLNMGPAPYYGGNPPRNYQEPPRGPRVYPQRPMRGQNLRDESMYYQQNRQYYGGARRNNYDPYDQRNYTENMRGNYRMNYSPNYPDYNMYPHNHPGHYYHEHEHDYYTREDDYYAGWGNRRNRPNPYCDPHWQGYDPCYGPNPVPTPWMPNWMNKNFMSNFLQRPRVNNFFRNVGIATVGVLVAPSVTKVLRPLVVKTVKEAMSASEEIKDIFADAREGIEDIFAEAKWDKMDDDHNTERHNG